MASPIKITLMPNEGYAYIVPEAIAAVYKHPSGMTVVETKGGGVIHANCSVQDVADKWLAKEREE